MLLEPCMSSAVRDSGPPSERAPIRRLQGARIWHGHSRNSLDPMLYEAIVGGDEDLLREKGGFYGQVSLQYVRFNKLN